jgi:hypothetical protein
MGAHAVSWLAAGCGFPRPRGGESVPRRTTPEKLQRNAPEYGAASVASAVGARQRDVAARVERSPAAGMGGAPGGMGSAPASSAEVAGGGPRPSASDW